jgi:hypothetical protein
MVTAMLAVLVANDTTVSERLLRPVGITDALIERLVFSGLEDREHFASVCLQEVGQLDLARMEADLVATAQAVLREEPAVGAFLLVGTYPAVARGRAAPPAEGGSSSPAVPGNP